MKINYIKGDATVPQAKGIKIITHICNNIGKDFVLAISNRWSEPEKAYRLWHRNRAKNNFELGEIEIIQVEKHIYIANIDGGKWEKIEPNYRKNSIKKQHRNLCLQL